MNRRIVAALALTAAACGGSSSSSPGPTVYTPPLKFSFTPTGSPAPFSTASPGSTSLGNTHVSSSLSGSGRTSTGTLVTLSFDTVCGYPNWAPKGNYMQVSWCNPDGDTLAMGNAFKVGTQKTSAKFSLVFDITATKTVFTSSDGSCHVTVSTATLTTLKGTFHCVNVPSATKETLSASGTFQAAFS